MLRKKYGGLTLSLQLIPFILAALCLILGSFYDLQLTQAVYAPNNFWSIFVEYFGTFPTALMIGITGILFFCYFRDRNHKNDQKWKWVLLILMTVLAGGYWGFDSFHRHDELGILSKAYTYGPLGVILVAAFQYPLYLFFRKGDSKDYVRKAAVLLIVLGFTFLFTFGIKYINVRPRYMWLVKQSTPIQDLFRNWYQFSTDKSLYTNVDPSLSGSLSYWLQSWPSGHTSFSAMTALSLIFASCNCKTKGKEIFFFTGGCIWCFLVALGRVLDGHHFLTDVATGALLTIISSTVVIFLLYRKEAE